MLEKFVIVMLIKTQKSKYNEHFTTNNCKMCVSYFELPQLLEYIPFLFVLLLFHNLIIIISHGCLLESYGGYEWGDCSCMDTLMHQMDLLRLLSNRKLHKSSEIC